MHDVAAAVAAVRLTEAILGFRAPNATPHATRARGRPDVLLISDARG
jgi:hypothetical protein